MGKIRATDSSHTSASDRLCLALAGLHFCCCTIWNCGVKKSRENKRVGENMAGSKWQLSKGAGQAAGEAFKVTRRENISSFYLSTGISLLKIHKQYKGTRERRSCIRWEAAQSSHSFSDTHTLCMLCVYVYREVFTQTSRRVVRWPSSNRHENIETLLTAVFA